MLPIRTAFLVLLLTALGAGTALAATHDTSGDRYVGADGHGPHKSVLPIDTVESITYEKMPTVHQKLEEKTGSDITFSFVYVSVGDDTMAVDPFRFNR